jgi:EmrB/QacA subfamily drug resistance transporter
MHGDRGFVPSVRAPEGAEGEDVVVRPMNQRVVVAAVYVAALFLSIMDTSIVNTALPTLGRAFHVRPDQVDLVSISYLVSLAVFIPTSGWLGDRLGGKRVLLGAIVVFTGASAACGVASSLNELVLFRVFQGAGGGLLVPVGMAMLYRVYPPEERVRAARILTFGIAFAPALAPILGGVLVTDVSWRWVFFVNAPIGVAAFVFGALFLVPQQQETVGRFDLVGFLLAGAGLGSLMYGIAEGPQRGWGSTEIIVTVCVGAVLLGIFLFVERARPDPLLPMNLYRDRLFRVSTMVMGTNVAGFLGSLYLLALFYQDGLGHTALESGLSTFPEAIGIMIGAQFATRVFYPRFGPRRLAMGGNAVVAIALLLVALGSADTSLWYFRVVVFVLGLGQSCVTVSMQAAAFATISPANTGRASTLFNAQRQLGAALGVAIATTVIAAIGPHHTVGHHVVANLAAYRAAFVTLAGILLANALAASTINDADARSTMVRRNPPSSGTPVRELDRLASAEAVE